MPGEGEFAIERWEAEKGGDQPWKPMWHVPPWLSGLLLWRKLRGRTKKSPVSRNLWLKGAQPSATPDSLQGDRSKRGKKRTLLSQRVLHPGVFDIPCCQSPAVCLDGAQIGPVRGTEHCDPGPLIPGWQQSEHSRTESRLERWAGDSFPHESSDLCQKLRTRMEREDRGPLVLLLMKSTGYYHTRGDLCPLHWLIYKCQLDQGT